MMTEPDVATPSAAVTIGIPFRNAWPALADAVRSVFAQTFQDWALVLVDDGSTDGAVERLRAIDDPRVVVLSDGQHRGLAARLNQIAGLAKGPWLARMDADDLMHPDRVKRQVARFSDAPGLDAVGTGAMVVDTNRRIVGRWPEAMLPRTVAEVLERGVLFIHPTVMYRAEFARAHQYEGKYPRAEDLALWCKIVEEADCSVVEEPLLFYRVPVPLDVDKYAATKRSTREILRDFGNSLTPRRRSALYFKTYWTVWAYRLTGLVGAQRLLLSRRVRRLTAAERTAAEEALRIIDGAKVPGWD